MSTPRDRIEARLGLGGPPLQTLREGPPQIPDHELVRRIGQGAYGEVWLARNALGTWRAVKIVYRDNFKDARPYEREFAGIRRFEPLSRSNEGFVDILQVGREEAGGWFYYVMELADAAELRGGDQSSGVNGQPRDPAAPATSDTALTIDCCSLNTLFSPTSYTPRTLSRDLHHRGRLPLDECLTLGLTLSLALGHLHRHGLIHRDVKPSNIIFVGGVAKLADIGLVTEAQGANTFVGTEGFVPPEGPTSPQADLYALGKVLYEAAMGKDRNEFPEPFTQIGTDRESVALMELNAVLLRACAPDPQARYASAEEMHADLALLHSGGSVKRRHLLDRQFKMAKRVGALALATTLLISSAFYWQRKQTQEMALLAEEKSTLAEDNTRLAAEARRKEIDTRRSLYAADMNLAQQALTANNLRQVRALLNNHVPKPGEPDLRGFEWRYLWAQAQGDELLSIPGHTGGAWRVAFSPDGLFLATSGADRNVRIWNVPSWKEVTQLQGLQQVLSLSFAPHSHLLSAASYEGVWIWDTRTWSKVRELSDAVSLGSFSPDGTYFLTLTSNRLELLRTTDWAVVDSIDRPTPRMWEFAVSFSPRGDRLALTVEDGVAILSVPGLREIGRISKKRSVRAVLSFAPDGTTVATDGPAFSVVLWNTREQRQMHVLQGHSDHVYAARFSPDGQQITTCGADQTIKLWNVDTGKLLASLKGQADEVFDLAYSPKGNLLASVGVNDGLIKFWSASASRSGQSFRGGLRPAGFDQHGALVALTEQSSIVRVDPRTLEMSPKEFGQCEGRDVVPLLGNHAVDGRMVTLWNPGERRLDVWDLELANLICSLPAEQPRVHFDPHLRWVITDTGVHASTIWRFPSAEPLRRFTNALVLAVSPDGSHLVTKEGTSLSLWDSDRFNAKPVVVFNRMLAVRSAAFSPDGKLLATVQESALIRLWDVPSGREMGSFSGHTRLLISVAFSPDGRTLASISDDRTVRLWNVETCREMLRFQAEKEDKAQFGLRFSPDGRSLVATRVDEDGPVTWVWYAPSSAEISAALNPVN